MKKYLMTWGHGGGENPINHGLVEIDDKGYVYGDTPIEDFGMYFYRDEPFPECKSEMADIFIELMDD